MLYRIDVKDAFRQIPVDLLHAVKFSNVYDEYAVVDVFLQFGWRSSPGYWDLVASSLEHAHNQTSFRDVMVSGHGRSAIAHVSVDADAGWETMPIPPDCKCVPSAGVVAGSPGAGMETLPIHQIANVCRLRHYRRCHQCWLGDADDPARLYIHTRIWYCRRLPWP